MNELLRLSGEKPIFEPVIKKLYDKYPDLPLKVLKIKLERVYGETCEVTNQKKENNNGK